MQFPFLDGAMPYVYILISNQSVMWSITNLSPSLFRTPPSTQVMLGRHGSLGQFFRTRLHPTLEKNYLRTNTHYIKSDPHKHTYYRKGYTCTREYYTESDLHTHTYFRKATCARMHTIQKATFTRIHTIENATFTRIHTIEKATFTRIHIIEKASSART